MKQTIRAFALGILCATVLLSITYYMNNKETKTEAPVELTKEQMITKLENEGYTVEEEQESKTEQAEYEAKVEEEHQEQQSPTEMDLVIEQGMSLQAIAEKLYEAKMINDPEQFVSFLDENNYSTKVQVGEFKLNTEMTDEEIANTITNQ